MSMAVDEYCINLVKIDCLFLSCRFFHLVFEVFCCCFFNLLN